MGKMKDLWQEQQDAAIRRPAAEEIDRAVEEYQIGRIDRDAAILALWKLGFAGEEASRMLKVHDHLVSDPCTDKDISRSCDTPGGL